MTNNSADARRGVRVAQLIFAAAAALALFGAASTASVHTATASGLTGSVIAVDDDSSSAPDDTGGGVDDQGQTSGDIFTQNAQDQSTA
jgi:hypothetical protein